MEYISEKNIIAIEALLIASCSNKNFKMVLDQNIANQRMFEGISLFYDEAPERFHSTTRFLKPFSSFCVSTPKHAILLSKFKFEFKRSNSDIIENSLQSKHVQIEAHLFEGIEFIAKE